MDIREQIRTPQGKYPVLSAALTPGKGGFQEIAFHFCSPSDLEGAAGRRRREASVALESLAFLFDADEGGFSDGVRALEGTDVLALAEKTGPLFGRPQNEALADWVSESMMARDVVAIQKAINQGDYSSLNDQDEYSGGALVVKQKARGGRIENPFAIYIVSFDLQDGGGDAFLRNMPSFPCVKHFSSSGQHDYAIFTAERDEVGVYISVGLLCFELDMDSYDFAIALDAFGVPVGGESHEILMRQVGRMAEHDGEAPVSKYGLSGEIETHFEPLDPSDAPRLKKLVQAVISLRLQGIGIDPFIANEADGFMSFPSFSSYLWYSFSQQLKEVRIGFCEQCGRGYSLASHRGADRKFCSQKCRTKAKNDRTKAQRDKSRELFFEEGRSVAEIVRSVYLDEQGCKTTKSESAKFRSLTQKIQKDLAGYPALKHAVDADLKKRTGAPFARRCIEEGVFTLEEILARAEKLGISR